LRADLAFQRRETEGTVDYIAKQADSGRFFRLREAEHFIASQLDGATSPEEICRRVEERFGNPLPPETLERFLERLDRLGFLETAGAAAPPAPSRRFQGNPLYLRLRAFDPDRLLDRLAVRLRWLFTPWTVAGCVAVVALGSWCCWGRKRRSTRPCPLSIAFSRSSWCGSRCSA
jgi:hypothetical protein